VSRILVRWPEPAGRRATVIMTSLEKGVAYGGALADLRDETPEVRETLSALGRLLGAALIAPARTRRSFVAEHLEASEADVVSVSAPVSGIDVALVEVALARLVDGVPGAVLTDDEACGAPGYELVKIGIDEYVSAPNDLAAYLPGGTAYPFDVVVIFGWGDNVRRLRFHVRRTDHEAARAALADLLRQARTTGNFYRGQTLRVVADDRRLDLLPVESSAATRAEVVHDPAVWDEVDATVGGLARHGEVLVATGLGAARGILVVGPPGVGKTALCRVIAAEMPTGTTVLLADASVTPLGLTALYRAVRRLAPAVIVLDDVDLLAGDRRAGTGRTMLHEFLTLLDGFAPAAPVVTVATTNAPDTIDPAMIRPGRFDSVIEIGLPGRAARAAILARYVHPIADVDVSAVALDTEGASGADLREIVRRAVLEHGPYLTAERLADIARSGRWRPSAPTGQYL
jgi:transitional endoplasmic reticulum ATPase